MLILVLVVQDVGGRQEQTEDTSCTTRYQVRYCCTTPVTYSTPGTHSWCIYSCFSPRALLVGQLSPSLVLCSACRIQESLVWEGAGSSQQQWSSLRQRQSAARTILQAASSCIMHGGVQQKSLGLGILSPSPVPGT